MHSVTARQKISAPAVRAVQRAKAARMKVEEQFLIEAPLELIEKRCVCCGA
jgi:hypothetical protein